MREQGKGRHEQEENKKTNTLEANWVEEDVRRASIKH